MPGGSNRTTSIAGSSASTNGRNDDSLVPTPLHSSNGGRSGSVPGRTATRSRCSADRYRAFHHASKT